MTTTFRAPPLAKLMIGGAGIMSLANSMSIPFLAIFLRNELGLQPAMVGFLLGSSVFFSILAGFFGGALSDVLGRKVLLFLALLGVAASYFGFSVSHDVVTVFLCSAGTALCSSTFIPVSKALLCDLLPEEHRVTWFSRSYLAYNAGFAVGPLIGVALGLSSSRQSFLVAAFIYVLYAAVVACALRLNRQVSAGENREAVPRSGGGIARGIRESMHILVADHRLLYFLAAALLIEAVHSRISVLLAQYLVINFSDGTRIFAALMATNAVTVVGFQMIASRYVRRRNPVRSIIVGGLMIFTGMVAFSMATAPWHFIAAMIVLSVGETFIIPSEFAIIDHIAPKSQRGSYFGAQTFAQLGGFIGPYLGGVLLATWGGVVMFLGIGVLALFGIAIYVIVGRRIPGLAIRPQPSQGWRDRERL